MENEDVIRARIGRRIFHATLTMGRRHPNHVSDGCGFADPKKLCILCELSRVGPRTDHSAMVWLDRCAEAARSVALMLGSVSGGRTVDVRQARASYRPDVNSRYGKMGAVQRLLIAQSMVETGGWKR